MDIANSRGRVARAVVSGLLGSSLGAFIPAALAVADQPPGPASQASLTGRIAAQNDRLRSLAAEYQQAQAHDQQVVDLVGATQATLAADVRRVASLRALLRRQAVMAFTEQGATNPTEELLVQRAADAAVSEGFLSVTTDRIGHTVNSLHAASQALEAKRAQLQTVEAQDRASLGTLVADRQSLLAQLGQEESLLAKLRTSPPAGPPTSAGVSTVVPVPRQVSASSARPAPPTTASRTTVPLTTVPPTTVPATTAPPAPPPTAAPAPPPPPAPTAPMPPPTTASPPPAPPAAPATSSLANDFAELRQCESGDNYQIDTGNGFYGAYQFAESTWLSLGYTGFPNQAPPAVQDQAAERLQAEDGWAPWPACSALLGL